MEITQISPIEKDNALREIRKLLNILTMHGNVLVPSLNGIETFALDRMKHFANKLNDAGMSLDDIELEISKL